MLTSKEAKKKKKITGDTEQQEEESCSGRGKLNYIIIVVEVLRSGINIFVCVLKLLKLFIFQVRKLNCLLGLFFLKGGTTLKQPPCYEAILANKLSLICFFVVQFEANLPKKKAA